MLQKIVSLIALVATIINIDPDDFDEINDRVKEYNAAKDDLRTFHGDTEMASAEVIAELDKAVAAARVAVPGDESLIEDQDAAAGESDEGSGAETSESLVEGNTREALVALAGKEGVDIEGATTKMDIATRIVADRAVS